MFVYELTQITHSGIFGHMPLILLLIQEHCLYKNELGKICKLASNAFITGKSSMDESIAREGRPFGGCAILWKANLNTVVRELECTHERLCGIIIQLGNNVELMCLNTYMPCDGRHEDGNFVEYMEVLSEIEQLLHIHSPAHVIFGGDMNTDLNRSTPHTNAMVRFINDFNLVVCIDAPIADVAYTYASAMGASSRIDHFFVTSTLADNILECSIVDNLLYSDHTPLKLKLDLSLDHASFAERAYCDRVAWDKVSTEQKEQYKSVVGDNLSKLSYDKDTFQCADNVCKCIRHREQLCSFYNSILNVCIEASKSMCGYSREPKQSDRERRTIPGWTDEVEHLRQEALFWHRQWRSMGRPHQGEIAERRRITRSLYHKAVRGVIKQGDIIRTSKMAEAICDNRYRDLWAEVRKIKGRNKFLPSSIDGHGDDREIAQLFQDKYKQLYNSVPYDAEEMRSIELEIDRQVNASAVYVICVDDLVKGIQSLKMGKSGGEEGMSSDHIIRGPKILYVLLTLVINSMLVHGLSPDSMLVGTMVPIPKDRRQLVCASDNFRAITLSSIVGKLLDILILSKEHEALKTSHMQFGFKADMSTTLCTYVMMETVSYYNAQRSNVYVLMLDASKAFDRVNYGKLFRTLLSRHMSPLVLRLLLYMYTKQRLQVRWGNHTSEQFAACNGVKQGAILSPILFSVYMDGLFDKLEESGVGCHMGNYYAGGLGYADDLTLLAPTLSGLLVLIKICEQYAVDFDIIFNGSKSKFLVFRGRGCSFDDRTVCVNGTELYSVNSAVHLGHHISTEDRDSLIIDAISKFWRSFNMFMADFSQVQSPVKCKLFMLYCCTYYGAPLWSLQSNNVAKVCIAWRKALRRIWNVSPRTHCDVICLLSESIPLEICMKQRFLKFIYKAFEHSSPLICSVAKLAMNNPWSSSGQNYCEIIYEYTVDLLCTDSHIAVNYMCNRWWDNVSVEMMSDVSVLLEMIMVRNRMMTCDLNYAEVADIIERITVS